MNRQTLAIITALVILTWYSFPAESGTPLNRFIEDFTTTQYLDTAYVVEWDTVAAEARLLPFDFTLKGSFDTPGYAYDVAISGRFVFIADSHAGGLQIIDVGYRSDFFSPSLEGFIDTPGSANAVCVNGEYAFVADGAEGLQIIDVSDPTSPVIIGNFDTSIISDDVAVDGDFAFFGVNTIGVIILDISDPANPSAIDTVNTSGTTYAVAVDGDLLYVADGTSGLQIIDISSFPASIIGSYNTPGTAVDLFPARDIVYIADSGGGLIAIDTSDPTSPSLLGSFDTKSPAIGVYVDHTAAYVASSDLGLHIIDVSNPVMMSRIDQVDTHFARKVTVAGEYAYVADHSEGLKVIDLFDPAPLCDAGGISTGGISSDVFVKGRYAYHSGHDGLSIFDISDPASPVLLGSLALSGEEEGIFVHGEYALVCANYEGLELIDITDPTSPGPAYFYDTGGSAVDVAAAGNYGFIAGSGGLQVIDISDPTLPSLAGSYNTTFPAQCVAVSGNLAFLGTTSDFFILDITDPTSPSLVDRYTVEDGVKGFDIENDRAYIADGTAGFKVLDISNPVFPSLLYSDDTPGDAYSVAVDGEFVIVFDGTGGAHIYLDDRIFGNELYQMATLDDGIDFYRGDLSGGYAFISTGSNNEMRCVQYLQSTFDKDHPESTAPIASYYSEPLYIWSETPYDYKAVWARVTPQCDAGIRFYGMNDTEWTLLEPGVWTLLNHWGAGSMFGYSAFFEYVEYLVNPTVTQVELELLYDTAVIDSVVDVPGDQGGWARIFFTRSGFDFPTGETPLAMSGYYIWRRVDDPVLSGRILEETCNETPATPASSILPGKTELPSHIGEMDPLELDGRVFVNGTSAGSMPDGLWEIIGQAPAHNLESYIYLVPTLGDSAATVPYSVFFITTELDDGNWYVSMPDSGYSVDNIPPSVPTGMSVAYNAAGGNEIAWDVCPANDFDHFRIYRSTEEDFVPEPGDLVHSTGGISWLDDVEDGYLYFYRITAVDYNGNESPLGIPETVTSDDLPGVPNAFALHQNIPNPFNPATTIRFDLPSPTHVRLHVYNVKGERIATLVDSHMAAGSREISWNGTDGRGRTVASGIYFYRLTTGEFTQTRKMVLLR